MSNRASLAKLNNFEALLPLATLFAVLVALASMVNRFQTKEYEQVFREMKKRDEVEVRQLYQLVSELLEKGRPLEEKRVDLTTRNIIGIAGDFPFVYEDPPRSCFTVGKKNLEVLPRHDWILVCLLLLLCTLTGNVVMGVVVILQIFVVVVQHRQQELTPQDKSIAKRNLDGFYLCLGVLSISIVHCSVFTVDFWISVFGLWELIPIQAFFWLFIGLVLLVFDLLVYSRLVQLNNDTFVPLPLLLIPATILAGGTGTEIGCRAHAFVPFPYFAMCNVFLCVCTRKPTFRITVFVFSLHLVWTVAVMYAAGLLNECRIGLNASLLNAVVCVIANTVGMQQHRHNFVFDSTDLGNKFWRIAVALCNCYAENDPKFEEFRQSFQQGGQSFQQGEQSLSAVEDIVSKADTLLKNNRVQARWPTLTELVFKFALFMVYLVIVKLNGDIYLFTVETQGDEEQQSKPSKLIHFFLMAIAAFLVLCVWALPFSRNEVASQDFRFLVRGVSFCSINIMVIHHCMEYGEIPALASFAAYCFDVWAWFLASVHPMNLTDFRILSMMVPMINVIAIGSSPTWLTQACSQLVLLELLDIRTQRLLSRHDKVSIMALRVLSMATLLLKSNRHADILASFFLFFPFSMFLERD